MASSNETIVLKSGDLFFLSDPGGDVPLGDGHALGLFYHDCRFLNGYTLTIGEAKPEPLTSWADQGRAATFQLGNPQLRIGDQTLVKNSCEILWSRVIRGERPALFDTIDLRNLTNHRIHFFLALNFRAEFEDIFAIRGFAQTKRGKLHPAAWKNDKLHFLYEGADQIDREVMIQFSPPPGDRKNSGATYEIVLAPNSGAQLKASLLISESAKRTPRQASTPSPLHGTTTIHSDNEIFNRVMDRSLGDLDMLRSGSGDSGYFAAGIPWYVALFGRDSIITALQMLAYDPEMAEQTIRLLAHHQGTVVNEWRDEEPGKILHELRVGEMANLNEIPHTPYYGTIDATPLWLILVGRHAAWTGDLRVFDEMRPHIEAALNWIEQYGDFDGDGYVEYQGKSERGLVNQGWKDSNGAIVNRDGSTAVAPIALIEVQGYVYRARTEIAALFRKAGDKQRAITLETQAQQLRENFNRDFWVADGYFALALQKEKRRVEILSSNAGHALWSGIAEPDRARQAADRLLSTEMFSGWGIRTLSSNSIRYDPLAYHLGAVWPHDNSLIIAGMKNYAYDEAALRLADAMIDAASQFDCCRLPELFGGNARETGPPAHYPIACQPQAWAAGAIPLMITTLLGLEPDAVNKKLQIVRPTLPKGIDRVEIKQLRVGSSRVNLLFERKGNQISAHSTSLEGDLEITIESGLGATVLEAFGTGA